ncbi:MAG: tRNA (adenosine(37)-N6)-threonylcarbamoyltransferase complex dimerization subunit type 1 TsaB [Henriciella sp.]|nr:tRNA (adenosine(37)-N6)-threonylcarbamoyltransferase complex dimerization subunit type 1 TsaB [Henriciella sp.]
MIVLAFHTAGPACELAVTQDGKVIGELREPMQRGQDARLPGLTQTLLSKAKLSLDQIDRFAVVTGPGSFTGIRVGVAFARGLALATKAPCLGITTLEAALPAGQQGSAIVALPAQKRPPDITYWTQTFRSGTATDEACEMTLETLADLLSSHPHMVYGDAEMLQAKLPDLTVHTARPTAARAAQVATTLDPDLHPARPTYARAPDAALPQSAPMT